MILKYPSYIINKYIQAKIILADIRNEILTDNGGYFLM